MIYNLFRFAIDCVMSILDFVIPKKDTFCFYITPHTSWDANQQALYKYIEINTKEKLIIVDGNNVSKSAPIKSLLLLFTLMQSRYVIFDHAIPLGIRSKRHIRVNLWHGTPLKKIRFHLKKINAQKHAISHARITDLLCANSKYDALLMSSGMNIPYFYVVNTGLPRNDYLLCNLNELNRIDIYDEMPTLKKMKNTFSKSILWAPTYRGSSKDFINPLDLSIEQQALICLLLEKHNACLWIRGHKFSKISSLKLLFNHPNVFDVSSLKNSNIVLRFSDILITDFSSIWVDFLLLDRPIIIYAPDYTAYNQEHGFMVDFESQLPVPMQSSFTSFINELEIKVIEDLHLGYEKSKVKFHHASFSPDKSALVYEKIKTFKRIKAPMCG